METTILIAGLLLSLSVFLLLQRSRRPTPPTITKPTSSALTAVLPSTRTILFSAGSAQLDATAIDQLRQTLDDLAAQPALYVELQGCADSSGNAARNRRLCTERSQAVARYLIDAGLPAERLRTTPGVILPAGAAGRKTTISFHLE